MAKNKKPRKKKSALAAKRQVGKSSKKRLDKIINQTVALYQQGKITEALTLSEKALIQFPNNPALLKNAGAFAGMINDLPLAEKYMLQSLELFPEDADAHNNLGGLLYNQKRYEEAETAYRHVLRLRPDFAEVHNNLGVLLSEKKHLDEAEKSYQNALKLWPDFVEAHKNLGILLGTQERYGEAENAFRHALRLCPDYPEVLYNLGVLLGIKKRDEEAENVYRHALRLCPDYPEVLYNLGILLEKQKRYEEAENVFRHALRLCPDYPEVHNNLGHLLKNQKRYEEAEIAYQNALQLRPDFAEVHNNLGNLLKKQNRYDEAETAFQNALRLRPDFAEVHNNLGVLLSKKKHLDEAEIAYQNALRLCPDDPDVHNNLGNLLKKQNRYDEAETAFQNALRLRPDFADALLNLSLLLLSLGRFQEGWQAYEARYHPNIKDQTIYPPESDLPQWQGEPLSGKGLLIWPEQGIGDEIQFARYLPLLKAQGVAQLVLVCDKRLARLFAGLAGVDKIICQEDWQAAQAQGLDYWSFMMSLPLYFKTTVDTIPASFHNGYLIANEAVKVQCRHRYAHSGKKYIVGISWWSGNKKSGEYRTAPLALWDSVLTLPGIQFVSLQYGEHSEEINTICRKLSIEIYQDETIDPLTNLDDFAAQVAAMDLVISIDNSTVHMAGALGVPVWTLLPYCPDWRWMMERQDSPWYPDVMRLFRQKTDGDWDEVVQRLVSALSEEIQQRQGIREIN